MTTSKKSETEKSETETANAKSSNNFPKAYMRLRTVLDALEIGALQYCLRADTTKGRIERAHKIEELIIPIIEILRDRPTKVPTCAEGYYNCGGVCVPYQCPATDR